MSNEKQSKYILTTTGQEYVLLDRELQEVTTPVEIQDRLTVALKIRFTWFAAVCMLLMAIYLIIASLGPASDFNSDPFIVTIWISGVCSLFFAGICAFLIKNLINAHTVDFDVNQEDINRYQLMTSAVHGLVNGDKTHAVTGHESNIGGYKYNAGASFSIKTKSKDAPKLSMESGFSIFSFPQLALLAVSNKGKSISSRTEVSVFGFLIWAISAIGWGLVMSSSPMTAAAVTIISFLLILFTHAAGEERFPSIEDGRILTPLGTLYQDEDGMLKGLDMGYEEAINVEMTTDSLIVDSQPKDAGVIGYTWKYSNKDGSRDMRFNDNKQHYNIMMWRVTGVILGQPVYLDSSNAHAARELLLAKGDRASWAYHSAQFHNRSDFNE